MSCKGVWHLSGNHPDPVITLFTRDAVHKAVVYNSNALHETHADAVREARAYEGP